MTAMQALITERDELLKKARDIAAKAEAEGRGFTDDEHTDVRDNLAKAGEKNTEIDRFKAVAATREETDAILSNVAAEELNSKALNGSNVGVGPRTKSIGRMFTDSDGYKGLMTAHGGHISDTTKGINSTPVNIGSMKSLLTGSNRDDSAGVLVEPDRLGLVEYPQRPLTMRDLVTVGNTGSDRVEYAQLLPDGQGETVNRAAGVAEATTDEPVGDDVTARQAGVKPKSQMSFRKASADVVTIAHWLPATKRALSDAAQLRTLIDGFLSQGVAEETERMMLVGDSEDPADPQYEEFDGILNFSGTQDVTWQGDIPATARRIIRQVSGVGGQVTGFAVSPEVNEQLDLMTMSDGRYYGGGPFGGSAQTLWGRPRVEVPGLSGSDVIIGGDFRTCILWDREQTTLTATDSHQDFFIRNLVAILAEARAGFGALNPQLLAIGHVEG